MSRNEADQGQPSLRRQAIVYDQHAIPGHPLFAQGRPWGCTVEKSTGLPIGAIKPRGWRAPWVPPQGPEIFVFDKDNPTRFTLNYNFLLDQWAKDSDDADAQRTKMALARGWDPADPEKQDALDQIADKPEHRNRPELIYACIKGDPWILGATPVVNPKVERFLPKKATRLGKLLSRFEQALEEPVSLSDDLETLMDIEEAADPEATPRGRVPVKSRKPKAAA